MTRLMPLGQAGSRSSVAASDTTYHSFHDIELFPPATPPKGQRSTEEPAVPASPTRSGEKARSPTRGQQQAQARAQQQKDQKEHPLSTEMRRQDSGYESLPRRPSISSSGKRRTSTASSSGGSSSQPQSSSTSRPHSRPTSRGRPVIRRSPKTSPYPVRSAAGQVQALHSTRAHPFHLAHLRESRRLGDHQHSSSHSGFFHFPMHPTDLASSSDPDSWAPQRASLGAMPLDHVRHRDDHRPHYHHLHHPHQYAPPRRLELEIEPESPSDTTVGSTLARQQMPPQSTHYWTSDRTRRFEYAAIDAAHRGVKGWVKRHLVPDCFIPKEKTRVAFDDDSGSVRRYRLDLDDEASCVGGEESKEGKYGNDSKVRAWARMKSW